MESIPKFVVYVNGVRFFFEIVTKVLSSDIVFDSGPRFKDFDEVISNFLDEEEAIESIIKVLI